MILTERMRQDIGIGLDAVYSIIKGRVLDEMDNTDLATKVGTAAAVLGGLAQRIQDVLNEKDKADIANAAAGGGVEEKVE